MHFNVFYKILYIMNDYEMCCKMKLELFHFNVGEPGSAALHDTDYERISSFLFIRLFLSCRLGPGRPISEKPNNHHENFNICSALWNLTSQTRTTKLEQLGLVPMISFPCQLLHHVLYLLGYAGYVV
jgi:hypothetical protein